VGTGIGALVVVGAVVATVEAIPGTITRVVIAAFVALAFTPLVEFVQRRLRIARGLAVLAIVVALAVVGTLFATYLGNETADQVQGLQEDLPRVLDQLTDLPLVGQELSRNDVPEKVEDWLANLPERLAGDDSQLGRLMGGLSSGARTTLSTIVAALALLVDGPRLVRGARRLVPPDHRERADELGRVVYDVLGRYFAGSLLVGLLHGLVVLITGVALGVPLTPFLAVWAAIFALVPQIGGAVGGAPFVAVALTEGARAAVVAAIVYVAYMTLSNNVVEPIVVGRAVRLSPPTTMVAAISGYSVAGVAGALLAVPVTGATKAAYLDLRPAARVPGPGEPTEDQEEGERHQVADDDPSLLARWRRRARP
jgi:putative heme transporter